MRARDFISEAKVGDIPKDHGSSSRGLYKFIDDGTDRLYNLNQVMKAAAMADGRNTSPLDMDSESFAGKHNMAYPYTEAEHTMMKQAFATVSDTDAHELVRDHNSREQEDIHKISPVTGFKGYERRKKKK
jgi:hypothetical protein